MEMMELLQNPETFANLVLGQFALVVAFPIAFFGVIVGMNFLNDWL